MILDYGLFAGEEVPLRYDLGFLPEKDAPRFILTAHDVTLRSIRTDAGPIMGLKEHFPELGDFVVSDKALGFDSVLTPCEPCLNNLDGFSAWRADLPKEVIRDLSANWAPAIRLSCTLGVIAQAFWLAPIDPNPDELQQLVALALPCKEDLGGYGLLATLSPEARTAMVIRRDKSEVAAREAMIVAYRHMHPTWFDHDTEFRLQSFGAEIRADHISFDLIGSGLISHMRSSERHPGWNLMDHEVNSPVQQLALLAGLCAPLRLVRETQLRAIAA